MRGVMGGVGGASSWFVSPQPAKSPDFGDTNDQGRRKRRAPPNGPSLFRVSVLGALREVEEYVT